MSRDTGTLVMNWQVFDALGIFLGYSANMILFKTSASLIFSRLCKLLTVSQVLRGVGSWLPPASRRSL
jgi:hypothetical protein